MKIINLSEQNSLVNQFLKEMRSETIQKDAMRFRRNIQRIGEIMAYEISKTLDFHEEEIQTPLDTAKLNVISDKIVLGTIFRAGLPMHDGFLNYFDQAENAFVSAYRSYKDEAHSEVDIHIEYLATPALDGKTLILSDPMLATGGSMELAYKALLTKGTPEKLFLCCIIGTQQAVDYLQTVMPENATLYTAAIDPILNVHKYIVPGLGDAGDLAFGDKL